MTRPKAVDLYYDPFDFAIDDDPYPVWRRLREEAPLYYNEPHDFYALSRWDDVARELPNWQTYRSGRGTIMDVIKSGLEVPPGVILFEDPPQHDLHRRLLSKVFTPRRMAAIEPLTRQFCMGALDSLLGQHEFDVIADLGALIPMRTIGYLLGIPEQVQQLIREVEDDGGTRQLTRTEVLTYTSMIAGAGNETTTRLIGFACQLLADHPDQRSELVADPELIPGAIEEVLRFEAPTAVQARYVAHHTECLGTPIAEGSIMLLLNGSANRDEARFPNGERFDIHRRGGHLSFGQGLHFCLGTSLACMQARVVLEELLKRWPEWDVDYAGAAKAHTASVRGWSKLPIMTR